MLKRWFSLQTISTLRFWAPLQTVCSFNTSFSKIICTLQLFPHAFLTKQHKLVHVVVLHLQASILSMHSVRIDWDPIKSIETPKTDIIEMSSWKHAEIYLTALLTVVVLAAIKSKLWNMGFFISWAIYIRESQESWVSRKVWLGCDLMYVLTTTLSNPAIIRNRKSTDF